MRDIIPYVFWPWFALSCFILLRRRITGGSWRAMAEKEEQTPIEFPPPPPPDFAAEPAHAVDAADEVAAREPEETDAGAATAGFSESTLDPGVSQASTAVAVAPRDPDRAASRTLADAVEGIAMPCDLAPLMGAGGVDPREVAFFTAGHAPGAVGSAVADELERLGYEITPVDECSIRAESGPDLIRVRLVSTELASEEVMQELHPSAPEGALVVEMKLT